MSGDCVAAGGQPSRLSRLARLKSPRGRALDSHQGQASDRASSHSLIAIATDDIRRYRQCFAEAEPFRHVVIDGFLEQGLASDLLREFPKFDAAQAMNEFGEVGGKAVNEKIESISPTYAVLYQYLNSSAFLGLMGEITGIDELLSDPNMYGGGTHENLHGQDLDPHVDFNCDPLTKLHRRLNLLIYLNEAWEESWGGCIEIHSNPRRPDENIVKSILPIFNRAVLFETNEYSWHGFKTIRLPDGKRDITRKSISIYLYSRTRPKEEIFPEHGTFYVQRPIPEHIREGYTLTGDDVEQMKGLLLRRDAWIEHYQGAELRTSALVGKLEGRIDALTGLARQRSRGWWRGLVRRTRD